MGKVSQQNQSNSVTVNGSNKEKVKKRTRKSVPRDAPLQRSSVHRGVTRHRWTGRYEAHLWDKNCWNESQNKKGRQVYLGAYDDEEAAAHAYDLAALKYWGQGTILNFPLETYEEELGQMEGQSKEEYIGSLRRKSSGFSRGVSKYRGVARHHHNGRWEARIGRVFGNKYLYLGTYATQEEAATAYDMAAIEYRGLNAVTNFDLSRYVKWLRPNVDGQSNSANDAVKSNEDIQPDAGSGDDPVPSPTFQLGFTFLPHHHQQCSDDGETDGHSQPPRSGVASSASSALGILLQSSKFKEMMERTSVIECPPAARTESADPPRSSFPDDIQTYFDCQDSSNYTDGDDGIFADLNSFASPIFHCELDG